MKHLVLVGRFNQYTRIPAQYIPAHHHGPDPLKLPPAPLYGSDPLFVIADRILRPCISAGVESIPRQPGIAEMVVPVVHCRFQIWLVNEMPVTPPAIPSAFSLPPTNQAWSVTWLCVVARLWCRRLAACPSSRRYPAFSDWQHCTAS